MMNTTAKVDATAISIAAMDTTPIRMNAPSNGGHARIPTNNNMQRKSNIPSLVCAFLASATTGGTTYAFGIYSAALKRSLNLSQSQLDTISTCFFFAGLFSFIPGYCSDKFGVRLALTAGGCSSATMLISYWMVATQYIELSRDLLVPTLSMLGVLIFLSSGLVTGAVFKVITACCEVGTKGSAVGIAKGYVGLGAGLYACIFESIRNNDTGNNHHQYDSHTRFLLPETPLASSKSSDLDFLLMAACFSIGCVTVPGLFLLPTKTKSEHETYIDEATPLHFRTLFVSLFVMAIVIVGKSLLSLSNYDAESSQSMIEFEALSHNSTVSSEYGGSTNTGGIHYGVGLFLLSIWAGPILCLLHLPRAYHSIPDDVDNDVESEIMGQNNDETNTPEDCCIIGEERTVDDRVRRRTNQTSEGSGYNRRPSDLLSDDSLNSGDRVASPSKQKSKRTDEARRLLTQRTSFTNTALQLPIHDDNDDDPMFHRRNSSDMDVENENTDNLDEGDDDDIDDNSNVLNEDTRNKNLVQMLQTPSACLMLFTSLILVGAGTVITNNVGQMVESLGFASVVTPAATAIFSVAQAFGRISTGTISESALNWSTNGRFCIDNGVPRTFFFVFAAVVACIAHFAMSLAHTEIAFVVACALTGLSFGMVWPLLVLVVGELFGPANVGANYMFFDGFTSATGTLILSKIVAQEVYESHIDSNSPDDHTCIGMECFRLTHIIISGLCVVSIATALCLTYSSRHVYNRSSFHVFSTD